jgi:hypothetical protein
MESWFLADRQVLLAVYGGQLHAGALPGNPSIEQIPKADVLRGLKEATRDTQRGSYRKGEQSFRLLEQLDPGLVEKAGPYARRFLDALRAVANGEAP